MNKKKFWTKKEIEFLINSLEKNIEISEIASSLGRSIDSVSGKVRRLKIEGIVPDNFRNVSEENYEKQIQDPLLEKFLERSKTKKSFTFEEISDIIEQPYSKTKKFLLKYKDLLNLKQIEDGTIILMELSQKTKRLVRIQEPKHFFKIGVIADTHVGSTYFMERELRDFLSYCEKEKIKRIFIAGDLLSGSGVYRGQIQEQDLITFDKQKKKLYEVFPQDIFEYYFICGNHDESFHRLIGMDPGKIIEMERKDFKYLGLYQGGVRIHDIRIELHHGSGGGAYAMSYKGQKIIENIEPGEKPDILILGHYHSSLYFETRNVHLIQPGCFQSQSLLLKRLRLSPTIAGWILEVGVDPSGSLRSLQFYIKKYYTGGFREGK